MIEWIATMADDGLALLEALANRVPAAPRAFLHQLCKKQRIFLDGAPAVAATPVIAGLRIAAAPSGRFTECIAASRIHPAQILHEDRECLIVNKPAGLLVHPAPGHPDDLLGRVQDFLSLRGERYRVAAIHRLDIGTSGPVLFGKGQAAIRLLGQLFMAGQVDKGYLALVGGNPPEEGTLQSRVPAHGRYRPAFTHFRRLGSGPEGTLLEIRLITGRRHQIRRQLADAGWPLLGDRRYGDAGADTLHLHCHRLAFRQPVSGREISIAAPAPAGFAELCRQIDVIPGSSSPWGEISDDSP